ncbi:potassium channel family protein, partial [Dehalococcoidia bacterium]|nr:potassium channel family protein [Dehalococcoidia bacterium]
LLGKVERITEIPLMILSLLMIPLLLGPFLWDMLEHEERLFFIGDILIWVLFAVDMVIKTALSTDRVNYLKTHWLELIVVAIPWFRPLRIVRLIAFAAKSYRGINRAGKPDFLLVYAVGLVMVGATVVTTVEQGYGSSLVSFSQSLWWSLVTITTVGYAYGDTLPVSTVGRGVAVILMLGGLGIFGAITANLAAVFSNAGDPNTEAITELTQQISELKAEISSTKQ